MITDQSFTTQHHRHQLRVWSSLQFHIISKCILSPPPLCLPSHSCGPRRRLNVEYIFMINTFREDIYEILHNNLHTTFCAIYIYAKAASFLIFHPVASLEEHESEQCAVLQIVKQISLHYDRLELGEDMPPPLRWLTSAMTRDTWHVTRAQWWWWWASCTCVTSPTGPGSTWRARRRSPPSMSSAMVR